MINTHRKQSRILMRALAKATRAIKNLFFDFDNRIAGRIVLETHNVNSILLVDEFINRS
jgi:hypothetical protein